MIPTLTMITWFQSLREAATHHNSSVSDIWVLRLKDNLFFIAALHGVEERPQLGIDAYFYADCFDREAPLGTQPMR
jgi:hypothetical protein